MALMKPLALVLAASFPTFALANGGGYIAGTKNNGALGAFQPKNAEQIEMQTEDLQIDLRVEHGHVDVVYTLHNPGKAVTAEVGFPCTALAEAPGEEDGSKKSGPWPATPPLRNFTVELDGQKIDSKTVRNTAGEKKMPKSEAADPLNPEEYGNYRYVPFWYTFKLPFASGQNRKLHVSYDTEYYLSSGSVSDDSHSRPETFTYLFSTAAVWKGAIGEGKVTIRAAGVPADDVKFNLPKRFHREGNTWTWNFKNFEPGLADDLVISAWPEELSYGRPIAQAANEGELPPQGDFVKVGKKWSLHHHDYTATASSTLAPTKSGDEEITYEAANVADGDPGSCWAEGAKGPGVGESLTLKLRIPRKVSAISVRNGYAKWEKEELYYKNGRVAEFAVSINGGKPFTATIPDERLERRGHLIPIPEDVGEVKTITLTIQKVYPGSAYEDTCISDIELITPLEKEPKITQAR
jgi:hypothetical protein